jgi:hypothetical protein
MRVFFWTSGTNHPRAIDIEKMRFKTNSIFAVLPVSLHSIKAVKKVENIDVQWKVENEIDVKRYEVEKSLDGVQFSKIGSVLSKATTAGKYDYNWLDTDARPGDNFYRVRFIDANGAGKYTEIVKVFIESAGGSFSIYPNPMTGDRVTVEFNALQKGIYSVELINSSAQVVQRNTVTHQGGTANHPLPISAGLPNGVYYLRINSAGKSLIKKLVNGSR